MKSIITKLALFSIVLTLGFSCNKSKSIFEPDNGSGNVAGNNGSTTDKTYGKLSLDISTITDIIETKSDDATGELLVPLTDFVVTIYNNDGSEAYKSSYNDLPNVIGLPVGEGYLATVTGGESRSAAFNAPYYYGEASFKIVADFVNTVYIESALANTRVSLELSTSFLAAYGDDWDIKIRNEEYVKDGDEELVFTPANKDAIGYVRPSNLYVIIRAGSIEKSYEISDIKAADHHTLAIDLLQSGSMNFQISINNTVVDKEVDLNVPSDDETLGNGGVTEPGFVPDVDDDDTPTEPVLPAKPTIIGSGFDIANVFTFDKQNPSNVICLISAEGGIANLNVTIDSDELVGLLPDLFGGNTFDMANPTELQKTSLMSIGLLKEGEEIKGLTSMTFDVTGFMGLLGVNNGNSHNFTLEVVDAKGQKDEQTLKVLIKDATAQ